ncbi:MAG: hybrid sensor histidine kinase/response regulator [Sphingomonas bacterium]|nr:hybrid sensor histidine kinase/response regulator [Sphingomonas bacterium]
MNMPAKPVGPPLRNQPAPGELLLGERSAPARVLVVDDDENNLLAIRTVLEDLAEVVTASSGDEALRQLLRHEFAVILLDVYMPGMDGYEVAGIIRGREQSRRIPIVFLSAVNKESAHLLRGYAMGAVDYVFKPVEPVVLRSKVSVFVDLFVMRREIERKALQERELLDANLKANAERLRVERELRIAEQRQAAIIDSLPLVLYRETIEAEERVPYEVSGNFATVTGYDPAVLGETPTLWRDRLHPDDRDRIIADRAAQHAAGNGVVLEYRWQCADGGYRHFLDQAVLLRDADGRAMEYAGSLLDVSDRKDLENKLIQAQKMDAIGQLTGGIAHDFNNLLAAVLGGLALIEKRATLSDDHRRILDMTRRAAEQGSELVGRLLAFARKQTLEPAPVDLALLAEAACDLLTHTLGGLVTCDWHIADDVWCAYADEAQLELALMNLIINARDAMAEGGTITVTTANRTIGPDEQPGLAPGDYVGLIVSDHGPGMAPDILERVLEPFFTTKPTGKGTGLGLSMVYGFVEQSGGAIRIDSRVDEGTKVTMWLPRAERPSEATKADETQAPAPETPPLRILLVDDHAAVRATTAALLQDSGHEIVEAADGGKALKLLAAKQAFDLLITDYAMPNVSGAEVIAGSRKMRPTLPAIMITGYADPAALPATRRVTLLAKPFTPAQMGEAIQKALTRGAAALG